MITVGAPYWPHDSSREAQDLEWIAQGRFLGRLSNPKP